MAHGPQRVLIAGCGYVGLELARRLMAQGVAVWGLKRRPLGLPPGVRPLAADLNGSTPLPLPEGLDAVVYAVAADGFGQEQYRAAYVDGFTRLRAALGESRPRLIYVSSTGVYGQTDGEWVDEDSPAEPTEFSGRILLEGEALARQSGWETVIVRLGGIYGPGRTRLIDQVREGRATRPTGVAPVYTNRIHRDDAAGALAHLLRLEHPEPVYLGVDDEPADRAAVLAWLAERLGRPLATEGSPPPAEGRGGNKRCSNARLRAAGYRFRFPTYREGFAALMKAASEA